MLYPISMKILLNKIGIMGLIVFVTISTANAQKKYFMYLQSENNEPFYIMINNKNYSSSLSGYMVIPRLKNGKYFFVAGFPKDKYPEQKFSYVVNDKDVGFVLKQYGKDGWGLFNVVNFSTIMANANDWEQDKMKNDTIKIDDSYSINTNIKPTTTQATPIVQQVTQNSNKSITKTEEPNTIAATKEIKTETNSTAQQKKAEEIPIATSKENVITTSVASGPIKPVIAQASYTEENITTQKTVVTTTASPRGIIKSYQKNGINGIDEMYIDYTISPTDTIVVFIPLNTEKQSNDKAATTEKNTESVSNFDTHKNNSNQYNTSCVNLATEADYLRVRKLMSAETSDDKMIQIAKKTFANKCFYTEQIQKLGLLFLSEQSRLKFFKTSYSVIFDRFNYPSLETQFTLSSVINQFRQSL